MKTIGLIGGMSWESSAEYYRLINQDMKQRLGGHRNAQSVMVTSLANPGECGPQTFRTSPTIYFDAACLAERRFHVARRAGPPLRAAPVDSPRVPASMPADTRDEAGGFANAARPRLPATSHRCRTSTSPAS